MSDTKPVSIGRRKGRLRLHDSRVSKDHAEIYFADDAWVLRDLGSANGTYINRQRVKGLVELEPGDLVQMGRVLFKIVRCDGIGMDADTPSSGEISDGNGSGVDQWSPGVGQPDEDPDLDALFSDSPANDTNDDSNAFPAINEHVAAPGLLDNQTLDLSVELESAASSPEAIEVGVDVTDEDEDSFFADLGEATDTFGGANLSAISEADTADEAPQASGHDPFLADHKEADKPDDNSDLISLEDESGIGPHSAGTTLLTSVPHEDLTIDAGNLSDSHLSGPIDLADADEDDDQAPALVGLHLAHAAPQQPDLDEEDAHEIASDIDADEESSDLEPHLPTAQSQDPSEDDDIETSNFDPELGDDLTDIVPASVEEPAEELTTIDDPADPAGQTPTLHDDAAAASSHTGHTPEFDIDAAFDALSEGLDDSFEAPAIGKDSEDEPKQADRQASSESSNPSSTAADEPDPLIGSQLDVSFIRDALSKLEETPAEDNSADGHDGSPKASAQPIQPPTPPRQTYLQSAPPGLNPSSLNPPAEPRRSHPPRGRRGGKGKWFLTLLLFMSIGGVGGWLISQNYERFITGRDTPRLPDSNASLNPALPGTPTDDRAERDQTPAVPNVTSALPAPVPPTSQPIGPDPFSTSPGVIGAEALDGLTRGSNNPPPVTPQPPTTEPVAGTPPSDQTNPPDPNNSAGPVPGNTPAVNANPPFVPGTDGVDPAVAQPPARIVFLIDASGSLVDSLPQMLVWLNRALQTIEQDERFAIYFFKSAEPIAIKPEGMLAPTRDTLNLIREDWLSPDNLPLFPSGRSNPTKAIEQALSLDPTDIYLLSDDAFAMHQGNTTSAEAMKLVKQAMGDHDVRIHGVQFFYRSEHSILETLANQTKGTFEFVRERVVPDAEPIDLLEELGGE